MAGLKSLLAMLTACAFPFGIGIVVAGMVMVVVVNGVNGVLIIGPIAEISIIFAAFALIVGMTPASTSTVDVFSSTFFNPEYLMRGCDLETVVNSNWYDWLVLAPTVKFVGVVSSDDGNGVAVWKILDGTSVWLVVSIDTILLGLNVGVFMTILPNFAGTFNSFVATGMDRAATDLTGDVIDGIVSVTGAAATLAVTARAAVAVTVVDVAATVFFNVSAWIARNSFVGKNRRENVLTKRDIFGGWRCVCVFWHFTVITLASSKYGNDTLFLLLRQQRNACSAFFFWTRTLLCLSAVHLGLVNLKW